MVVDIHRQSSTACPAAVLLVHISLHRDAIQGPHHICMSLNGCISSTEHLDDE